MSLRENTGGVGWKRSEGRNYLNSISMHKILKVKFKKKANFTQSNFWFIILLN